MIRGYRLYTDGSSHARSGKPGGWAWLLIRLCGDGVREPLTAAIHKAQSGGEAETSNNRMEMMAILKGLDYIGWSVVGGVHVDFEVEVCSDSQYALNMAAGTWNASSNLDIVNTLRAVVTELRMAGVKVKFSWVRGHNGEPYNELVDRMCGEAKERIVRDLTKPPQS